MSSKGSPALHNVVLVRAMEADTDMGHMLAFGMDSYQSGFHKAEVLCRAARAEGGFVVSAHPFRGVLGKHMRERPYLYRSMPNEPLPVVPAEALDHPVFKLANAIEVVNGGTADEENGFAMEVASLLRKPVTGGERCPQHPRVGPVCDRLCRRNPKRGGIPDGVAVGKILPGGRAPLRATAALHRLISLVRQPTLLALHASLPARYFPGRSGVSLFL